LDFAQEVERSTGRKEESCHVECPLHGRTAQRRLGYLEFIVTDEQLATPEDLSAAVKLERVSVWANLALEWRERAGSFMSELVDAVLTESDPFRQCVTNGNSGDFGPHFRETVEEWMKTRTSGSLRPTSAVIMSLKCCQASSMR
jgi:hypothetical protein